MVATSFSSTAVTIFSTAHGFLLNLHQQRQAATISFLSHHQQLTTFSSSTAAGDIALLFSLHNQRLLFTVSCSLVIVSSAFKM
jgi:hypothetical protein